MENTRKIYFKDNRKFLKYAILKEHEWYLYRFQKKLRAEEKATDIVSRFIYRFSKNILGTKLGIYIPAGVFDEGLHIWHYGNIIVNAESKVGKNCMLHGDNCIGNNGKTEGCPIIGDNVDIGTGAKILGKGDSISLLKYSFDDGTVKYVPVEDGYCNGDDYYYE